jgi:hypothetical protein
MYAHFVLVVCSSMSFALPDATVTTAQNKKINIVLGPPLGLTLAPACTVFTAHCMRCMHLSARLSPADDTVGVVV